MNIAKPAAALTSGLLARKGAARPAMRRQLGSALNACPVPSTDDLGWNDMGDAHPETSSPVARQIATLHATLSDGTDASPPPVVPISAEVLQLFDTPKNAKAALAGGRKSAFTLRIDAERHLRLRLLSAVSNRSAQQLLIAALDALIAAHPDIEVLATDPKTRSAAYETGHGTGHETGVE